MSLQTHQTTYTGLTPEEITKKGEEFYLNKLKETLEKKNLGDYVVINTETEEFFVNKDLTIALNKARAKFPDKLFFIVQIGSLQKSSLNFKKQTDEWLF